LGPQRLLKKAILFFNLIFFLENRKVFVLDQFTDLIQKVQPSGLSLTNGSHSSGSKTTRFIRVVVRKTQNGKDSSVLFAPLEQNFAQEH